MIPALIGKSMQFWQLIPSPAWRHRILRWWQKSQACVTRRFFVLALPLVVELANESIAAETQFLIKKDM